MMRHLDDQGMGPAGGRFLHYGWRASAVVHGQCDEERAFIPFDERLAIINDVIKPGYAKLMSDAS